VLGRVRSRGGKHGGIRDDRGVAMTEFVLVLPVLLLVVVGIIAFGLIFFFWLDANRLASETARWAAINHNPFASQPVPQTLQEYVKNSVPGGMQSNTDVCIDLYGKTPASLTVGDPVRVRVERPFSPFPFLWENVITVRASATMRVERVPVAGLPFEYQPGPPPGGKDIGTCGD
jgi:TadE-like protein